MRHPQRRVPSAAAAAASAALAATAEGGASLSGTRARVQLRLAARWLLWWLRLISEK